MQTSPVPDFNQIKAYNVSAAVARGQLVKQTANDTVAPCSAATDAVFGVAIEDQSTVGRAVSIAQGGEAEFIAGGAITRGAQIASDGSGRGVALTPVASGGGTVARSVGMAKEAVLNAGERSVVQIAPCPVVTA